MQKRVKQNGLPILVSLKILLEVYKAYYNVLKGTTSAARALQIRVLRETPCMRGDRTSRLRSSMIQTRADNAKNFLVSWLRSPFSARFGAALRSKITPTKNSRSFRFDRGYAPRFSSFFFPFLLARYRVIMTALWRLRCQSSFAAARSRAAPPRPQHARASLLISCLPIFLLFISARSSSTAAQNLTHRWLMLSLHFCRAYYRSHCASLWIYDCAPNWESPRASSPESFRNPQIIT